MIPCHRKLLLLRVLGTLAHVKYNSYYYLKPEELDYNVPLRLPQFLQSKGELVFRDLGFGKKGSFPTVPWGEILACWFYLIPPGKS